MTEFTRRNVITGAATAAAGSVTTVSPFSSADAAEDPRMPAFMKLSTFLTGFSGGKLSPFIDVINIKQTYFDKASKDPVFDQLLKIFTDNDGKPDVADKIFNGPDRNVRYLARNITIAWYIGAWCDPKDLAKFDVENPPPGQPDFKVISAPAYTQGVTWRAAQAHPMGYSDQRFGYWAESPPDKSKFFP